MGCPADCAARIAEIKQQLCDCCGILPPSTAATLTVELLSCVAEATAATANRPDFEFQILCDPTTGQRVCLRKDADAAGNVTVSATIVGTTTPYTGDLQALVDCGQDFEEVQECFETIGNPDEKFTRITWFEKDNLQVIVATTWINAAGAVIAAPANVQRCEDPEFVQRDVEQCALVDNLPNYSVGDRILSTFVANVNNPLAAQIIVYNNLSNGTYPQPFYLQVEGVDLIGTFPNSADFGDCEKPTEHVLIGCLTLPTGEQIEVQQIKTIRPDREEEVRYARSTDGEVIQTTTAHIFSYGPCKRRCPTCR